MQELKKFINLLFFFDYFSNGSICKMSTKKQCNPKAPCFLDALLILISKEDTKCGQKSLMGKIRGKQELL